MDELKCSEVYSTAKNAIKCCINDTKQNFIYIGHFLREIRDNRMYQEDGYNDFDSFMAGEIGKDKGWASRCISVASQFATIEGGQPVLAAEYQDYSLSLLIEMVAMTPEQRELVSPDTEVKQAREIKKADREKSCDSQLSEQEAQEESAKPYNCDDGQSCYCCHRECDMRQEYCYCVHTPMGSPFPCEILDAIDISMLDRVTGGQCQFVDLEKAYHRAGDGEPVPCCENCEIKCAYACQRSTKRNNPEQAKPNGGQASNKPETEPETVIDADFTELPQAEEYTPEFFLAEQREKLDEMLKAFASGDTGDVPHKLLERQKTIVAALAAVVKTRFEKCEQPELPILKNNDQRKDWINDYKAWGLWYRDENIDVNYYKFDFENGSRLIAAEYPQREMHWKNEMADEVYYHLLEKGKQKYGGKVTYDEKYSNYVSGMSEIVECLKQIQKKGKG